MGAPYRCMRQGCTARAHHACAVLFYPDKAVQRWNNCTDPLQRLVLALFTCAEHAPQLAEVLKREDLEKICEQLGRQYFMRVDPDLCVLELVGLDDETLQRMLANMENEGKPLPPPWEAMKEIPNAI